MVMADAITPAELVAAFRYANPDACIQEMESGVWLIDGDFALDDVIAALAKVRLPEPR